MHLLVAQLLLVVFMQVGSPAPIVGGDVAPAVTAPVDPAAPVIDPLGSPRVDPPGPSSTTPGPSSNTQVISQDTFSDYLVHGTDHLLQTGARGGFEMMHSVMGIPPWLASRARSDTTDQEQGAQLNDQLRWYMLGLVPLAVAVTILSNVTGLITGKGVPPGVAFGGTLMVGLGALLGFYNRFFAGEIVDLVAGLFSAVAGSTIEAFIDPGMTIASFATPLIGALLAILYLIVAIALTFVWWIQWIWVIVLSAVLSLALLAAFTPFVAPFGRQVIKKWVGSMIDPFIMLVALRLGAPFIDGMHAPSAGVQIMNIGFMIVAWQSPGFFAGALGASSPWLAQAYALSRMAGAGRFLQGGTVAAVAGMGARVAGGGGGDAGGGGVATGSGNMPTPDYTPAHWQAVPWGAVAGRGGGNAVHNKTGRPEQTPPWPGGGGTFSGYTASEFKRLTDGSEA